MKKTLLIGLGLIICIPLTLTAVDVVHKVGVIIMKPLSIENRENLSFGKVSLTSESTENATITVTPATITATEASVSRAHKGVIAVNGYGTITIQSTPPTQLEYVRNFSVPSLALSDMKIVNGNYQVVDINSNIQLNGSAELYYTQGTLTIPTDAIPGEYKADWRITIIYVGDYGADTDYNPQ